MALIFFWAVVAALTLAVLGYMIAALLRDSETPERSASYDLKVFRDQLVEVDRDLSRGLISTEEAERLRADLSRRILAADSAARADGPEGSGGPRLALGIAVVALISVALGFGVYMWRGAPGLDDQPMALRLAEARVLRAERMSQLDAEAALPASTPSADVDPSHLALVGKLREVLAERPDDLRGQQLLARNEASLGNYQAASRAQAEVVRLKGESLTTEDLAYQAEMMILAAGGLVTPEAEALLSQILERDPKNGLARFHSGRLFLQTGRPDLAFRFWAPLWEDSPDDAYWLEILRSQLPDLAWLAGQHRYELPARRAPLKGPSEADIAAAADLSDADRAQMVRGMVEGLMTRLANDGGSASEWAQLLRALGILGELDRGAAILQEARERFADRPTDLSEIEAAATQAGITQ